MYRVCVRRLGMIAGLLAILMVTLAPAVSQWLASHHRLGDALATYCSADIPGLAGTPGTITASGQTLAGSPGKTPHSAGAHWQACPYCGFAAHTPALPSASVQLVACVTAGSPLIAAPRCAARANIVLAAAQPRAPPRFS